MNEIAVVFGSERHLVGTLTLPDAERPSPVAFILSNAGVIHRIGPHRFNVKLARELARAGFATLRFDLSGLGDSGTPANALGLDAQAAADLRAALDHVERVTGARRFVVGGICSGAVQGRNVAVADPRVIGLWMIDGFVYPTILTSLVRVRRQLEVGGGPTVRSWMHWPVRALRTRLLRRLGRLAGAPPAGRGRLSRAELGASMDALVERGVRVYFIYTGSELWTYNYANQLRDAFRGHTFISLVRHDFLELVDHTLTTVASQRQVIAALLDWARPFGLSAP